MARKPTDPDHIRSGTSYKKEFRDGNYDRIEVNVKKGMKEKYKSIAQALGYQKLAPFVTDAMDEKIQRDAPERAEELNK